jgi:hypothetical protein
MENPDCTREIDYLNPTAFAIQKRRDPGFSGRHMLPVRTIRNGFSLGSIGGFRP